jgi:cobalt-zinc-cadmium efflux system protein
VSFALTAIMMLAEFAAGYWYGSLMLVSDGLHMLSHAAALAVSWVALSVAGRAARKGLSYGLYRIEILAALFNGVVLGAFSLWILYESLVRAFNPHALAGPEITGVAVAGLVVNIVTAFQLHAAGASDLNTRSALLHMVADLLSSIAIVAGAVVIWITGWTPLDGILSVAVAAVVAKWSWGLLRESVSVLLECHPAHLANADVENALREGFPQIRDLHDLHVWEITSHFVCLSVHVVTEDMSLRKAQRLRHRISEFLQKRYGIGHIVIQMEC